MATYLIQVKEGTNTVAVIDPISFKNAVVFTDYTGDIAWIIINSVSQPAQLLTPATPITSPPAYGDFAIKFETLAAAQTALAQLYTDLNAYYNA